MAFSAMRRWLRQHTSKSIRQRLLRSQGRRYALIVEPLEKRVLLSAVPEVEPNDALSVATALTTTFGPTGFFTSLGTGSLSTTSDVDYWRFDGLKGDRVSVAGDGGSGNNSAFVELRN